MAKYRQHRGSLEDSIKTMVEIKDWDDLLRHLQSTHMGVIPPNRVQIELYDERPDYRIGWYRTYMVKIDQWPLGFIDTQLQSGE
jgi:uncharacterized short protein YbdD (DUF466 family)